MVNISASSTQAVLARSRHLSAIFVPAYGCVPSEFREYGPVIVAGSSPLPLVRIEGACDGEEQLIDRVFVIADDPSLRLRIRPREAVDHYLFRMVQSLQAGFRRNILPPEAYLESLAAPLVEHLRHHYVAARRERERQGLSDARLARTLAFIDAHLGEPVPMGRMADIAHLSPFHFGRMFKRSTGITPHAYLMRRRIEAAAELLSETELPLVDIAKRTGFRSQAHFCTAFRSGKGTTPTHYRRRAPRRNDAR
jgi:AraC-like DNA-binding protein